MKLDKDEIIGIICAVVIVLALLGTCLIPFGIRVAKDMWQWALYGSI